MGEPMTKERLENYPKLKTEVERLCERIARMKSSEKFRSMTEGDGSQHQPGKGDQLERAILRRMEYEEKMEPIISTSRREMEAIERAINSLADPMERDVLRARYTEGEHYKPLPWRDVALSLYHNDEEKHLQAAFRLHNKALRSIRKVET